jgi:hypothetical protein
MADAKKMKKCDFYPNQICQKLSDFCTRERQNAKFIQISAQASKIAGKVQIFVFLACGAILQHINL